MDLAARLPDRLGAFARLAYTYGWAWWPEGRELFRAVDPDRWPRCGENPVRMLRDASAGSLDRAAGDFDLISRAESLEERLRADRMRPFGQGPWSSERPIAFLCAEYAVHRSLPIYAGGLGVLAGDILKEASDRALPFVAVGLFYRSGYMHQRMDRTGWQSEFWTDTDPNDLPAALVTASDGEPLTVHVTICERPVTLQVWRVDVGRVPLYLLDADRPENASADRWITSRLYVGDRSVRLAQYAALGIGGVRALRAMGIEPGMLHLNEGHAAFAPLELARDAIERGVPREEALEEARSRTIFTTHTPLAVGNEAYGPEELWDALKSYPGEFGCEEQDLLRLGRGRPDDGEEPFGLSPLGIRMSRATNAVSGRHGQTARAMWNQLFPDRAVEGVPIGHVTNGVHVPTWMAPAMRSLLDRYLGQDWPRRTSDPATWGAIDEIPDQELWGVRTELRAGLVDYLRSRLPGDRLARGESAQYARAAERSFDPGVLTIGFARRAAAYKRFHLLGQDPDRAVGILNGPHPIQVVLSGKAHPQDDEAKRILQQTFALKDRPGMDERVAFVDDYDLGVAEQLVWGCDVWLNLPRPPLEASGTSGMKSALNGGLMLSVLDGWWEEGHDGTNGWGILSQPTHDLEAQDEQDAEALYELLEREVAPLFYERDENGIPRGWVQRMKASLRTLAPRFSAARMMDDYLSAGYAELTAVDS